MSERPTKRPATDYPEKPNKNTVLPIERNDQKYRILVHLLAIKWDDIKPELEGSKEMKWSNSDFDYIMRNTYGARYNEHIGRSIWSRMSEEYWQYIIQDVNYLRASRENALGEGTDKVLDALNHVFAPANHIILTIETNDQKYRTLIHLLAIKWDAIKLLVEGYKEMKWNSDSDYIMGIAYGDEYTEGIGRSIWNRILDEYRQNLTEDVNKVRVSSFGAHSVVDPSKMYV